MPTKLGTKYKRCRRRALRELAGIQKRARSTRSEAERKRDCRGRLAAAREMAVKAPRPLPRRKRDQASLKSVRDTTRKQTAERVKANATITTIKKRNVPKNNQTRKTPIQQKKTIPKANSKPRMKTKETNEAGNFNQSSSPSPPSTSESEDNERVEIIHVYLNL